MRKDIRPADHPLVEFIYRVFGERFAELLMAGYHEEPSVRSKRFYFPKEEVGGAADWVIEVAANSLPCRQEPLVLAAMLKLLLNRPALSARLEFDLSEIVEEMGWENSPLTHKEIDQTISKYVALVYDKRQKTRNAEADEDGGTYSLLTSYIRESESGGLSLRRKYNYGDINHQFIDGLRRGQVYFAGILFGLF